MGAGADQSTSGLETDAGVGSGDDNPATALVGNVVGGPVGSGQWCDNPRKWRDADGTTGALCCLGQSLGVVR